MSSIFCNAAEEFKYFYYRWWKGAWAYIPFTLRLGISCDWQTCHHLSLEVFILDRAWQVQDLVTCIVDAIISISSLTMNKILYTGCVNETNICQQQLTPTHTHIHIHTCICTHTSTYLERENIFKGFEKADVDTGNGSFLPNQLCYSFQLNSEHSSSPIFCTCSTKSTEALLQISLCIILQQTSQRNPPVQ